MSTPERIERTLLHLATLEGAGWSVRAIEGATGISDTVLHGYKRGKFRTREDVPTKVLALDPASLPSKPSPDRDDVLVPRIGTTRRIQALLAMGWRHDDLNARLGSAAVHRTNGIITQQGLHVLRSTHDRIAELYRELANTRGPSELTRRRALARGYATPAMWHDIDRDEHPDRGQDDAELEGLTYDEVAVERRLQGDRSAPLTRADRIELVRRARAAGWSFLDLEERAGITKPERYIRYDDQEEAS